RTSTAPFLLRLFWRQNRELLPNEFSVAPPEDTTGISDYSNLLPHNIRQQSVSIYTWPTCSLGELTGLLTSVLPPGILATPAVGTRLVYKLVFPDTRAEVREGGRGKWIDKPLGSVVIGGRDAELHHDDETNGEMKDNLEGDSERTLGDARFVIGDYVVCTILPPGQDGRVASVPPSRAPPRMDPYSMRGPPPPRENGYGGGYGRGGSGYRGGYGDRGGYAGRGGGLGAPPPPGDWRRGERPPSSYG
ncbi:hypothetical protein BAUCODRAFT_49662, partial [Baudoinia panamericana UAMH 10762]